MKQSWSVLRKLKIFNISITYSIIFWKFLYIDYNVLLYGCMQLQTNAYGYLNIKK